MTDIPASPNARPAPHRSVPEPQSLYYPGNIADRVDIQLGVLTQGVVDCMVLATGAFPELTEGPADAPNAFKKAAAVSTWQSARSAELRDAARLTEASARLLTGFAKLRGQFSQDFTIRHSDGRAGNDAKARKRNTTVTQRFSVPAKDAVSADPAPAPDTAEIARGLAAMAQGMAKVEKEKLYGGEDPREVLIRKLMTQAHPDRVHEIDELLAQRKTAPPASDPPPPPRGS